MTKGVEDLHFIKKLGKGLTGEVYLCTKKGRNKFFAVKVIDRVLVDNQPKTQLYLKNEINILKNLNHPNIVKLVDFKQNSKYYFIVMEYINGGELANCLKLYQLKNNKPFSEEIVQYLMRQIVNAIRYIHSKNIIHRDLKLENIMINFYTDIDKKNLNIMKSTIKIIDFGFASILSEGELASTAIGGLNNMDPLILKKFLNKRNKNLLGYSKEVDIWSLGTLCYEMIIGKAVFNTETLINLIDEIEKGNYQVPTNLSKEIVSFLNGMLQYDGKERLNINQLYYHPFLQKRVSDFTKINLRKVKNKIKNNQININIKQNNSIWAIFNQEDEQKLIRISSQYNDQRDIPIKEEDNNYQKIKSINFNPKMKHLNINRNNTKIQELNRAKTYNNNTYIFGNCKSIYGQEMSLNPDNHNNNNNNDLQKIQQKWIKKQINNIPTFNLPKFNEKDNKLGHISNSPTLNSENNYNENIEIDNSHNQKKYYNPNDNENEEYKKRSGCCFQ